MGLLKKLSNLFSPGAKGDDSAYWIVVKCNRCGEVIRSRVNLSNDLSLNYGEGEGETSYFCRKTLMGDQGCFQRIEVELSFDADRRLAGREIHGGVFVEPES